MPAAVRTTPSRRHLLPACAESNKHPISTPQILELAISDLVNLGGLIVLARKSGSPL